MHSNSTVSLFSDSSSYHTVFTMLPCAFLLSKDKHRKSTEDGKKCYCWLVYYTISKHKPSAAFQSVHHSGGGAAAIHLPASLFKRIDDSANVGMFFGLYDSATLFPVRRENSSIRQTQVCSHVFAATVGQNMSFQNLEQSVIVTFRLQDKERMVSRITYYLRDGVIN